MAKIILFKSTDGQDLGFNVDYITEVFSGKEKGKTTTLRFSSDSHISGNIVEIQGNLEDVIKEINK